MVVIVVTMIIMMVRPWACPDIGHVMYGFYATMAQYVRYRIHLLARCGGTVRWMRKCSGIRPGRVVQPGPARNRTTVGSIICSNQQFGDCLSRPSSPVGVVISCVAALDRALSAPLVLYSRKPLDACSSWTYRRIT